MRIFLGGFLAAHFILCIPGFARAEPQIEAHLTPDKTIKVGEACHFVVQLTWRSGAGNYRFPQPDLALENLTVEAAGEANETFQKEGEEWKKKIFRFNLKPVRIGKAKILPFRIDYLDPSQETGGHFEVGALELRVVPNPTPFYRAGLIAAALLAGVGVLGGWVLVRGERKKQGTSQSREPTLEEHVLSQFNANREEPFEVEKIFRAYLSEKYSFPGGACTSREILLKLEDKLPLDELKTLKRIFDTLEEWRYGGSPRFREERGKLYSEMVHYVEGKKII